MSTAPQVPGIAIRGSQDLESWLRGGGAVAIVDLVEDAATAGISRSQVRQWVHDGVSTEEGTTISAESVRQGEDEELEKVAAAVVEDVYAKDECGEARERCRQVALPGGVVELLTLPAHDSPRWSRS